MGHNTGGQVTKLVALEVDANTGKARPLVTPVEPGAYALSHNGKQLAVYNSKTAQVVVYDLDHGKVISTHAFKNENDPKRPQLKPRQEPSLMFSLDGKQLVVSRGVSWTTILDADTGNELPKLEGARELEFDVIESVFSANGRLLTARCAAGRITRVKDARTGQEVTGWDPTHHVLVVWDTQTGKALKTWKATNWVQVALCPTKPLLAILEERNEFGTRLGFWDFSAGVGKK